MNTFTPQQFAKWPADGRVETDLRRWLRGASVEERISFLEQVWAVNSAFALSLAKSSQLPNAEAAVLLERWLCGDLNHAQLIIRAFVPLLGKRRFWQIVDRTPLSTGMASMLAYQRRGA